MVFLLSFTAAVVSLHRLVDSALLLRRAVFFANASVEQPVEECAHIDQHEQAQFEQERVNGVEHKLCHYVEHHARHRVCDDDVDVAHGLRPIPRLFVNHERRAREQD